VVSNCGGLLTPLGDPPLFLGFLKGVPFGWTLQLWKEWLLVNGLLLVVFNFWDQIVFTREVASRPEARVEEVLQHEPLRIEGRRNFLYLGAVVATILAAGHGLGSSGSGWPFGIQEGLLLGIAVAAYLSTPHAYRAANAFAFAPIIEVAVLFAGIFVTMAPALLLLNANAGRFGLEHPWQFFWATGVLSSFLDNAPTYLTFAATACGLEGIALEGSYLAELLARGPEAEEILAAISCGAVMMGANSYIGNGPNFMVKAIAESHGVMMPSFFGYMAWSCGVLLPIFTIVTIVFFR
jgi:Na+/H+ antiporter NhaD/arsenite permease-like protein